MSDERPDDTPGSEPLPADDTAVAAIGAGEPAAEGAAASADDAAVDAPAPDAAAGEVADGADRVDREVAALAGDGLGERPVGREDVVAGERH